MEWSRQEDLGIKLMFCEASKSSIMHIYSIATVYFLPGKQMIHITPLYHTCRPLNCVL